MTLLSFSVFLPNPEHRTNLCLAFPVPGEYCNVLVELWDSKGIESAINKTGCSEEMRVKYVL